MHQANTVEYNAEIQICNRILRIGKCEKRKENRNEMQRTVNQFFNDDKN